MLTRAMMDTAGARSVGSSLFSVTNPLGAVHRSGVICQTVPRMQPDVIK